MTANHETAWLSLKNTLLHIIWAEDSWIKYSIQGLEDPNRPFNYSRYQTWDSITEYNSKVYYDNIPIIRKTIESFEILDKKGILHTETF